MEKTLEQRNKELKELNMKLNQLKETHIEGKFKVSQIFVADDSDLCKLILWRIMVKKQLE